MRVKILGSAAGGGFPQWNCACPNCRAVRNEQFPGKPRLHTQAAVSGDGATWFLLGASPDLRLQIESHPELHPSGGIRSSPIAGVILASADLDHALGLLLLRELQPFHIWATESVTEILRSGNTMLAMLNRVEDQVRWNTVRGGHDFELRTVTGQDTGITCRPIPLSSRSPFYANGAQNREETVIGLVVRSQVGRSLGFFPQLPILTTELKNLFSELDCLLLDGTFWSDTELIQLNTSTKNAREMGHIPVDGEDGTLRQLSGVTKPRKLYIHINNTNPMLNEAGAEYKAVRENGWELAEDGWQLNL